MARKALYTGVPMQVLVTKKTSDAIRAIAELEEVSMASVIRDIVEAGLDRRAAKSRRKTEKV